MARLHCFSGDEFDDVKSNKFGNHSSLKEACYVNILDNRS